MEEQTENWQLRSGTWCRDLRSETWRFATTTDGTVVNAKLSIQDIGRMIGARRDASTGQWFPSDFNYSPRTGTALDVTIDCFDSPWVPPFGASALSDLVKPLTGGLRQTPADLTLTRSSGHDPASDADRTLPPLAPGQHRFLVHKFDVASPTLMAIEPRRGHLLVLLPESKSWVPLERRTGGLLAEGPKNSGGWRMEVVEGTRRATLYLPTASGLAVVTPTLVGLAYAVEYFGEGPALGGPVAWAGEVWLPVLGKTGAVNLVGKPPGAARPIVLPTSVTAPKNGFEGPVYDPLHVIWPSEDGQLVLRLGLDGKKKPDWIGWPDGLRPAFSFGCPYLSASGAFWQLCAAGRQETFEYVEMGKVFPERAATGTPRFGTGRISYGNGQRMEGDPWRQPEQKLDGAPSHVVMPLVESEPEGPVVGLGIDAPQGVLALLESRERHQAVLQLQAGNHALAFGTLNVTRPWLASVFVYDAHLWVYHPELFQPLGWKLANRGD